MHAGSRECHNTGLNIFSIPHTQTSIEESQYVVVKPHSLGTVMEVQLPKTDRYMDLQNTFLRLRLKLTKRDGTDLAQDTEVSLVNNMMDSLFKQIDVTIANEVITNSDNCHAYKAYICRLLNDTHGASESFIQGQGFYKDVSGSMDVLGPENTGYVRRKDLTKNSTPLELIGKFRMGLLEQSRCMFDNVDMKL